jgi:hypothetical protein
MSIDRANDLQAFREFLDARIANGSRHATLDEILELWEYENSPQEEREETLKAIQRGLDDMHAGRTRPFEEFDTEFRRRHGLPPRL